MSRSRCCWLFALLFALTVAMLPRTSTAVEFMFQATVDKITFEGKPLVWSDSQMVVLARDGQLHHFNPRKAKEARKTAPRFTGYSTRDMRSALHEEFGGRYSIDSSKHYLVVHPPGESGAWGDRFEQLYRAFGSYFRVRGFNLDPVEFPLVAVVYHSRDAYFAAARQSGAQVTSNTLGHYDLKTNRVLMYDPTRGAGDAGWQQAASTVIHEAAHQTAYNVGLHSRTAASPQWLVEGLAMLFEAPGVHNSAKHGDRGDRINRERLGNFTHFQESEPAGRMIPSLVASDQAFRTNAIKAYADAWALTFYLSETRPREYEQYLHTTASRPPLSDYTAGERIADFRAAFGDDLAILESNFLSWMAELR